MKTYIAVPCMDEVDVQFMQSFMALMPVGEIRKGIVSGTLVYEARERLAADAVDKGSDYVLWLDSDMVFEPTLLLDLMKNEKDMICGLYCSRRPPFPPSLFKDVHKDGIVGAKTIWDVPEHPFQIEACGMGAILVKTEVLARCFEKYETCFQPIKGYGEDLSFCIRARELGYELWCDPNVRVGHLGKTIITYDTCKEFNNARQS